MSASGESNRIGVAIIGAGEMGAGVARRLRECGARVMTSLKGRSAASVERMTHAGIEVIDDDARLVNEAHFVLSIVPPGVALEIVQRYREVLRRSESKPFFENLDARITCPTGRMAILQCTAITVDIRKPSCS